MADEVAHPTGATSCSANPGVEKPGEDGFEAKGGAQLDGEGVCRRGGHYVDNPRNASKLSTRARRGIAHFIPPSNGGRGGPAPRSPDALAAG